MGTKIANSMANPVHADIDEDKFMEDLRRSHKMDHDAVIKEVLSMRNVAFEYGKLGSYMCVILNGLAITKVLDLTTHSLNIDLLKDSLFSFVAGLSASMLMLLLFHLSQSSYMIATANIFSERYVKMVEEKRFLSHDEIQTISKKHNNNGLLLNSAGIILAISSLILFVLGSFLVITAI